MDAILQALAEAGYEVVAIEPRGENRAITIKKDGIEHRFGVSPSIGPDGVAEMMHWVNASYERKRGELIS